MNEMRFLLKHSFIYGIGTVLSQAIGFVMLPVYTRYLTPKDYGILQLVEISTFMLGMVLTTGIAETVSRFYYVHEEREEKDKIVSTMYLTYSLLALCFLPIIFISAPVLARKVLDSEAYTNLFFVSLLSFVLGGLLDIGMVYLRVRNKSNYFTLISIAQLVMLLTLNIYFIVFLRLGVMGILYSSLITRCVFQSVLTIPILIRIKMRFCLKYSLEMLRFSAPLIPARLATTFINQSDRYFIRYFVSIADTGIYSLAQKLGTAIHLLITCPFQSVYEPRRFEIIKNQDAPVTFNSAFVYHSLALVFVGLGISIFIPEILKLLVTSEFFAAGKYVPIIVFSMIILGLRVHFDIGILWSKKTTDLAFINIAIAVVNLALNYLLIVNYGLWGAVYSEMIITFIHNMMIYWVGKKYYAVRFEFLRIAKLFMTAVPIYLIASFIEPEHLIIGILLKSLLMILFIVLIVELRIVKPQEAFAMKAIYKEKIAPMLNLFRLSS